MFNPIPTITTIQRLTFPYNYKVTDDYWTKALELAEQMLDAKSTYDSRDYMEELYDIIAGDMTNWICEPVQDSYWQSELVRLYLEPQYWVAKKVTGHVFAVYFTAMTKLFDLDDDISFDSAALDDWFDQYTNRIQ